ncbi:restriction endonuclease subunit S [Xylella fastidiosa subsp. multiplex]|uniref:restriction endonuclease subunit S n=2 Tax=Xylella fastidiosa TaxID=2371 RepID=UPI001892AF68|nr:restriction endonuclease subunit S [Xylella fastidiosa]QPC02207.1 restriction endonuclease subunit S [Xylella fastidiosa subsp. multiplex]
MAGEWVEEQFGSLVQFVLEKLQAKGANINAYISTENMLADFGGIAVASTLPINGSVTRFKAGDTLFSNIRTYFKKVWEARFDGCCSNDVLVFRSVNPGVLLPDYLYQICRWEKFTELSIRTSKGAKMPRGDKDVLVDFKFLLPPIEEQHAIAKILGTLDDKIELNRRTNETLEAMARALFKAWCVDFEPVCAKLEGRWQRGESLPGLPAHLYDLFPDRLIESEWGEIPEGWQMRSLDSIANYLNGLALQKFPPESENEFLPVIKIAQLRTGNTSGADKASKQIKPEYIVVDGDVLFSWSGSLEVEVWNGGRGALNQHLFKVTSEEVPKWFYFFATRHHLQNFRAIATGKATTMGHIQRKHLTDARIAVALPESMEKFDAVIAPLFNQMISNAQQSRSLAQLRDTLLPKLISGELRVPDAERITGATL